MRTDSMEEILERLENIRRVLSDDSELAAEYEEEVSAVVMPVRELESALTRVQRRRAVAAREVTLEQRRAQQLFGSSPPDTSIGRGKTGFFKAFLALEAEPEVGVEEGDVVLYTYGREAMPAVRGASVSPIPREALPFWREHWTEEQLAEFFISVYPPGELPYWWSATPLDWLCHAIFDRRAWGLGPHWYPRLHLVKPKNRTGLIRPAQPRRAVSQTVRARSDAAAIFELLADCGGRPPVEDRSDP